MLHHLALVSETNLLDVSELTRVSAALQKQVLRDLCPIWELSATVDAFARLEDVPTGYWPIIVRDDIGLPMPWRVAFVDSEDGDGAWSRRMA